MNRRKSLCFAFTIMIFVLFLASTILESSAWARAGGGGSSGSRGSRSFSTPSTPSSPSPSRSAPGSGSYPGSTNQPSSGSFSRSPFLQGLAGGVAGGFLGNMLFGSGGHASGPGGSGGGGGIGLFDIILLAFLGYFGWKFYKRWRLRRKRAPFMARWLPPRTETPYGTPPGVPYGGTFQDASGAYNDDLDRGLDQISRIDPTLMKQLSRSWYRTCSSASRQGG